MTETQQKDIFEKWLSQHKGLIFKIVRSYAFSAMDQDDLFQEIIIQVWHSISAFRHESSVTTWLYRIALNTAIKWTRKERKHNQTETLENVPHVLRESRIQIDERLAWLYEEIYKLDEIDRSVTLLLLEGFSYKEMANILGITESNVGVKINRIKKHLIIKSKSMITMEFEELQKIWDSQNNQPLYAINEKALHNRILSKRKQARHITNISELLLIIVNLCAGSFILGINLFEQSGNIFIYLMALWMLATSLFLLVSRFRRMKGEDQFDRSMHGDLSHAISVATYQVRLSQIMRWNIIPIGTFILLGVWEGGKSVWVVGLILIFFAVVYFASGWEHSIYKARKRELEILKNKLENEEPGENSSSW